MIAFEDLVAGAELPARRRVVTREDIRRYAEAGGDANPLHQDDDVARAAGFDGVIAHGMFTMGHVAACLVAWLGDPSSIRLLRAQFRSPVFPGDEIVAGGSVRAVDPVARSATVDLWVRTSRGGVEEQPIRRGEAELRFEG